MTKPPLSLQLHPRSPSNTTQNHEQTTLIYRPHKTQPQNETILRKSTIIIKPTFFLDSCHRPLTTPHHSANLSPSYFQLFSACFTCLDLGILLRLRIYKPTKTCLPWSRRKDIAIVTLRVLLPLQLQPHHKTLKTHTT
jgi:hypothetical protein